MTVLDINFNEHIAEAANYSKSSTSVQKDVQTQKSFDIPDEKKKSSVINIQIEKDEYKKEIEKIIFKAANQMNEVARTFDRAIKFKVHKESGRIKTEVIDKATNKVIRQIPTDEVLDMISKLKSSIGTILDIKS